MENLIAIFKFRRKWLVCALTMLMLTQWAKAQTEGVVTGTVITQSGEVLSGVTVTAVSAGSKEEQTTTTNQKGVFTFKHLGVNQQYEFTASYIGYEKTTVSRVSVKESGNNSILIKLNASNKQLDQVVVIGYGTQKREMVTGSIATIKAEDFNKGVISDPLTLISGKVAGLAITRPNGSDPNATADFSLRGATSVEASPSPLIIIDGVPGGDLNTIAPADIASMDVLRDGSASAIYGTRATGGVIIVTTKRGVTGPVKVNYNGYMSTEQITKKYDMLTGAQYRKYAADSGISITDGGANTDWVDAMTRVPFNHGHNLSFNGGNGKTNFNASLNYQKYQGIDLTATREFVNAMVRLTTKALNDKGDFSILLANSYDNKGGTFDNKSFSSSSYYGFGQALNENPTYPVKKPDGSYFETPSVQNQWNPVANTVYNISNQKEKRLLGTAKFTYSILPELRAGVSYSLNKIDFLNGYYTNSNLSYQQTSGLNGQASRTEGNTTDNIVEATAEYNKTFGEHSLNVIGGYSYQDELYETFGAGNNNFSTNAYLYYNLGAGNAFNDFSGNNRGGAFVSSYGSEWTLLSYFGRLIYNFKEKYLFNASIRREGSSKFGSNHKWGNFPAVSAGWILSKESFMQDISFIKNLKLRAGYGVTGNQGALTPYLSLATIAPYPWANNYGYSGTGTDGQWVRAYGPDKNSNPDLEWETKQELDLGFDFALFNNGWLSGSFDYYHRNIKNLLGNYNAQVPSRIWTLIFANAGSMENQGTELTLNAQFLKRSKFSWSATFVGAYNKNKIVSVSNNQFFGTAHDITDIGVGTIQRMAVGQPVNVFYGKVFAGFDPSGQWLFYNNAGKAVSSSEITADDYKYLGNSVPTYNFGLSTNITAGAFDAAVLFRSATGFKAANVKRIFHENINNFASYNLFTSALKSPVRGEPTFSSYYLENGNYLKVDNLTLGYTLPLRKNNYLQRVRLSVTGTNLLTITRFSGMDPELGVSSFNNAGVELNDYYYPRTRSFTFAINADF